MEQWTYAAGLILGSLLVLAVIFVLIFRDRKVGMGEAFLVVVGAFLVGLTLWARVKFSFGPEGWQAEFERMQQRVETLRVANLTLNDQVETMAVAAESEREQFVELTRVLQEQEVVNPQRLEMIRGGVMEAPVVDRDLLRRTRERLEIPPP